MADMSVQSRLMILGVVILTLITPVSVHGESSCPGTPPSRLAIGMHGRTTLTGSSTTHLRSGSGTNYSAILSMPNGTEFDVVAGPHCGTYMWWQIRLANGTTGWVPEGRGTTYYLEPYNASAPSIPTETKQFVSSFGPLSFSYPNDWSVIELRRGNLVLTVPSTSNISVNVTLNVLEGIWGITEDEIAIQGTTARRRVLYSSQPDGTETEYWELEFYVDSNRMAMRVNGLRSEIEPLERSLLAIAESVRVGHEYILALTDTNVAVAERFPSGKARVNSVDGVVIGIQATPGLDKPIIEPLTDGTIVEILNGPDDADGESWWYIKTPSGSVGWIEEFAYEQYLLWPTGPDYTQSLATPVTPGTNVDTLTPTVDFEIPTSEQLTIKNQIVKNFYIGSVYTGSDGSTVIEEVNDYQIAYLFPDQKFLITIMTPDPVARAAVEQDFLDRLGISKEVACELNPNVQVLSIAYNLHAPMEVSRLSYCTGQISENYGTADLNCGELADTSSGGGIVGTVYAADLSRECTYHVAEAYPALIQCWKQDRAWPNAYDWDDWARDAARKCGLSVDPANEVTPNNQANVNDIRVGDIVVWEIGCASAPSGHVAIVQGFQNGLLTLDEANWNGPHIRPVDPTCMSFIHIPMNLRTPSLNNQQNYQVAASQGNIIYCLCDTDQDWVEFRLPTDHYVFDSIKIHLKYLPAAIAWRQEIPRSSGAGIDTIRFVLDSKTINDAISAGVALNQLQDMSAWYVTYTPK